MPVKVKQTDGEVLELVGSTYTNEELEGFSCPCKSGKSVVFADKYSQDMAGKASVNDLSAEIVNRVNSDSQLQSSIDELTLKVNSIPSIDALSTAMFFQVPEKFLYEGNNVFTLPKEPSLVSEVRVYHPDNSFQLLQPEDFSVSGSDVSIPYMTPENSADASVRIFYYTRGL